MRWRQQRDATNAERRAPQMPAATATLFTIAWTLRPVSRALPLRLAKAGSLAPASSKLDARLSSGLAASGRVCSGLCAAPTPSWLSAAVNSMAALKTTGRTDWLESHFYVAHPFRLCVVSGFPSVLPGRFLVLIYHKAVHLSQVDLLVLDEAD